MSVAFSPDGRHIVSGSLDKTVLLWDAQTSAQVGNPLKGHTSPVTSVAFSPNGRHIVSGSDDNTILLWDAQTGGQVGNPLKGHTFSVNSVTFSPDGRYIVSDSEDNSIHFWDAPTGGQVGNFLRGVGGAQTRSDQGEITKPICVAPLSICFSSSTKHALPNAQSLFLDLSNVTEDCQGLVYLQDDGWIVAPNGKLLLWIPFFYHPSFCYTPLTRFIIQGGSTRAELDLSRMAHGSAWSECYLPIS